MTQDERLRYNKAVNVLVYKVINRPYEEYTPTNEQAEAMMLAVNALNLLAYDTGRNYDQQIAILNYHIAQPFAILFKDRYTMKALNQAVYALKYMLGKTKD